MTGPQPPRQVYSWAAASTPDPRSQNPGSIKPQVSLLDSPVPSSRGPHFWGPSTYSCPGQHQHLLVGAGPGPYLSVEVQETAGAVDIVKRGKGVDGAIDRHRMQPQGAPACHQEPVGRRTADEHLGVAP